MPLAFGEADAREARSRLLARIAFAGPVRIEDRERHVVERAGAGKKIEGLEHEADLLVAVLRERIGA